MSDLTKCYSFARRCASCNSELKGIEVGSPIGWICERCHCMQNPFQRYGSFREVLGQGDDQVTVRKLLIELVPHDDQREVVKRFNDQQEAKYRKRCKELGLDLT